ncbi:MAG: hypothetical protein M0036_13835 [Desulfobacteraceae bacterium]|nr:hypothetical protein [Desulfobacteraceae bacterium]
MRSLFFLLLTAVLLCTVVPAMAAEIEARTDFRYQGWTSDADENGSQFYWPIYVSDKLNQWRLELVAGYASTSGKMEGSGEHSISGLLDTKLDVAYAMPHTLGVDWLIGVDTNLPTGQTGKEPADLKVMLDPDLVHIVSPGEGWNVNPFVNLARSWQQWTLGFGAGYAFQGKYDYSSVEKDYDPGDIMNLAAEAVYKPASGWQTRLFGQYAIYGTDTLAGQDLLKRGNSLLVGAGVRYEQSAYGLGLTLKAISRDKNQYQQTSGIGVVTEANNSYGNEWMADLDGQYHLSKATTASAVLSYVNVEANGYETSSIYYVGQRTKTSLGLGLEHALTKQLNLKAGLEGFLMDDGSNYLHPGENRRYQGWAVSVAAITRF